MRSSIYLTLWLAFITLPVIAGPIINPVTLNEFIPGNKSTLTKRIYNNGDTTAFVRVTVEEIIFSNGSYSEQPLDIESLSKGIGTGLISSPARLIIPANGMQVNRMIFTGDRGKERYYRVRYIPVIPEEPQEFGLDDHEVKKYKETINADVNVLTGYGAIVTVMPADSRFNTHISDTGNQLLIENNGNASIVVDRLRLCEINTDNCTSAVTRQLRPGEWLSQPLSTGKVWKYTVVENR